MKTIEEAIVAASKCLEAAGMENPRLESEFLLAAMLHVPRTHLILHREHSLPTPQIHKLRSWVRERERRKPLAYVSGEQPFREIVLKVTPAVLVPRPETELLVEQAYRCLERFGTAVTAIDVGTGSGNIALSLSVHANVDNVIAIDRSRDALRVARSNMRRVGQGSPIQWLQGNLLEPVLKRDWRADVIVANLPYVTTKEMDSLEPELKWEPRLALDGGADGLRLIEPCISQAVDVLRGKGVLLLEIGAAQSKQVVSLFRKDKRWTKIQVFRDFAGLPRIVQAVKKER